MTSLTVVIVSDSGISWAICKSAPRPRQKTTPEFNDSVFYRLDAFPAAQPTASKHWWHTVRVKCFCISCSALMLMVGCLGGWFSVFRSAVVRCDKTCLNNKEWRPFCQKTIILDHPVVVRVSVPMCNCSVQRCRCRKFCITCVSWMPWQGLHPPPVISRPRHDREYLLWCLSFGSGRGLLGWPVPCRESALPTSCWRFLLFSSCRLDDFRCFLLSAASNPQAQVVIALSCILCSDWLI